MRTHTCIAVLGFAVGASAADVVSVQPLTNQIIMVHLSEGKVIHHGKGQKRSDERVIISPLDVAAASKPGTFRVVSPDDPAYRAGRSPVRIGRKSKGSDFAWFVDKWENNMAVNDRPDHVKDHWLYLNLPSPMQAGKTYQVNLGAIGKPGKTIQTLKFDVARARSEAVHVNLIGYLPAAPKFGYLFHWRGDQGGLDLTAWMDKPFRVLDETTRRVVFQGAVKFRKNATQVETAHITNTPNGNFQGADVYECDFSGFKTPGRYVLSVPGMGCSFPFQVGKDVYLEPFRVTAQGLYHNRSGIELKAPYTTFTRPAPHNPKLTPGFAGKLRYTTSRFIDWKNEDNSLDDKPAIEAGLKGPLDAWGWYQDAGDWDSYHTHLRVAQELLFAYEIADGKFKDGELMIPENRNGVPDIIDEAAWLPRFCHRLRRELMEKRYGTGGIGLRVCGDHFGGDGEGMPSYLDVNRTWIVSGEDPLSTYRYAGTAAQLALALKRAGKPDPEGVDWTKEARESFAWAQANTRRGDEEKVKNHRAFAAGALFRLTGDRSYESVLDKDSAGVGASSQTWEDSSYPLYAYLIGPSAATRNPELEKRLRAAALNTANEAGPVTAGKRAVRWGGNFFFPMLVGQQTTPMVLQVAAGYALAKDSDPEVARVLLGSITTTCDYFLGGNALNMTWVTGLGPRHPKEIFHMDAWYNGKGRMHPGLIPYGPWYKMKDFGQGPWDQAWAFKTVYPVIDAWPGGERWFENRCSPMNSEFTVHQNSGPATAIFGLLRAVGEASG